MEKKSKCITCISCFNGKIVVLGQFGGLRISCKNTKCFWAVISAWAESIPLILTTSLCKLYCILLMSSYQICKRFMLHSCWKYFNFFSRNVNTWLCDESSQCLAWWAGLTSLVWSVRPSRWRSEWAWSHWSQVSCSSSPDQSSLRWSQTPWYHGQ